MYLSTFNLLRMTVVMSEGHRDSAEIARDADVGACSLIL